MAARKHDDDTIIAALTGRTVLAAAEILGLHPRRVAAHKARLAKVGIAPEHGLTVQAPEAFAMGKVTVQRNEKGEVTNTWARYSPDAERQLQFMQEAVKAMLGELPVLPARTTEPHSLNNRLMACYPIGDLHVGMLSWPEETGEDWNLEIAERVQCGAMARLVEHSPPCEKATIINLGDWFHADNMEGQTSRSKHSLDMDGRYAKMVGVGIKIMLQCIESALTKHGKVHVINVIGNHDDTGAMWLSHSLAGMYRNEPRVTVDTSPAGFMYFRHGKVLVGCHHGHSCKADRLAGVMAADRAEDWGQTTHRYWWIGHVHHQSLKDYPGVTVESFRTLAAKDAYASWGGYRAPRDMKCIVLDEQYGEVARHTVNPDMVKGEAA